MAHLLYKQNDGLVWFRRASLDDLECHQDVAGLYRFGSLEIEIVTVEAMVHCIEL